MSFYLLPNEICPTTSAHFSLSSQYQELFSVCQAFSGPGSTKMHYCINLMHDGFLPAVLGFLIWR